jgi:hypothetical protein
MSAASLSRTQRLTAIEIGRRQSSGDEPRLGPDRDDGAILDHGARTVLSVDLDAGIMPRSTARIRPHGHRQSGPVRE